MRPTAGFGRFWEYAPLEKKVKSMCNSRNSLGYWFGVAAVVVLAFVNTGCPVPPIASFTATPTTGLAPLTVTFQDTSQSGSSPITSWQWDFDGDGRTDSTLRNVPHAYTIPGKYSVSLTVASRGGSNTRTEVDLITVMTGPQASFTATPRTGFPPLTVQFTDTSTPGTGPITDWAWDLDGDGLKDSSQRNPSFTFPDPGRYTVTLTVTTAAGTDQKTEPNFITVQGIGPQAAFTADKTSGEAPLEVAFTDSSTPGSYPITAWAWDFNNDSTIDDDTRNPSHTFASGGQYTVSLRVTTAAGSDTVVKPNLITVTEAPGIQWQKRTDTPGWRPRYLHTCHSFSGKLWVIGGYNTDLDPDMETTISKEVWSSSNGITWTAATTDAPWGSRIGHASAVFKDKLWVFGGLAKSGTALADIWSSPDGTNWTLVAQNAPWQARMTHSVLVHDNKLWVIGGTDENQTVILNDVWRSPDGSSWDRVTPHAQWEERIMSACVVHDGYMWLLGGTANDPLHPYATINFRDVWRSADGLTWTPVTTTAAWSARYGHAAVSCNGRIWLMGGDTHVETKNGLLADVWSSEDGATWTPVNMNCDWGARYAHAAAVLDSRIWVVGGGNEYGIFSDVWCSPPYSK